MKKLDTNNKKHTAKKHTAKNCTAKNRTAKKHKIRIRTIVLAITATLALLSIGVSIGTYVATPLTFGTTFTNVKQVSGNANSCVVIDDSRHRLVFCNEENEVVNINESSTYSNKTYYYDDLVVARDCVYVQQFSPLEDTSYLQTEAIYKYSLDGQNLGCVWEQEYDLADNRTQNPAIKSLYYDDAGTVYAFSLENDNRQCYSLTFKDDPDISVTKDSVTKELVCDTSSLRLPQYVQYCPSPDKLYFVDSDRRLFEYDEQAQTFNVVHEKIKYDTNKIYVDASNNVEQENHECYEGMYYPNSFLLQLRLTLFWVSVLYLAILLVIFVARLFVTYFREKNFTLLRQIFCMFLILVAVVSVVLTFSNYMASKTQNTVKNVTEFAIDTICQDYTKGNDQVQQIYDTYKQTHSIPDDTYRALVDYLEKQSYNAACKEFNVAYALTLYCDGKFFDIAESSGSVHFDEFEPDEIVDNVLYENDYLVSEEDSIWGNYCLVHKGIYDKNDKLIAVFSACYEKQNLNVFSMHEIVAFFTAFFAIAIAISFVLIEMMDNARLLIKRYRMKRRKNPESEATLCRLLTFLGIAASSVDSALVVLVARDMLADTSLVGNAFIMSLPLVVASISYILGNYFYHFVSRRMSAHSYCMLGVAGSILCFGACAYCVFVANFVLLLVFLFLANLFNQLVLLYSQALPVFVSKGSARAKINRDISTSTISGYSLSTLIAGYSAEIVGNFSIYVIALVPLCILFLVVAFMIPKRSITDSRELSAETENAESRVASTGAAVDGATASAAESKISATKKSSTTKKFLFAPAIIVAIICINFPYELMGGYKSFLFPLIADNSGLSKSVISNIVVFCNALIYYAAPLLNKLDKKVGSRAILISGCLILGLMFLNFALNKSIFWSIIVLMATIAIVKIMQPAFASYWQQFAIKVGVDKKDALSIINTADSVNKTIRGPVFGWLVAFGANIACIIIGIYCSVSSLIFAWVSKDK